MDAYTAGFVFGVSVTLVVLLAAVVLAVAWRCECVEE